MAKYNYGLHDEITKIKKYHNYIKIRQYSYDNEWIIKYAHLILCCENFSVKQIT